MSLPLESVASKRILIVEDHEDNRNIYRTILTLSGYCVIEAHDGRQGIALARTEQPDLILMDVSIPHIDGWDATRILKADPETAGIPIVALTAHAMEEDRLHAKLVGCDGYLAKPVEPRRVVQEIERFLGTVSAA